MFIDHVARAGIEVNFHNQYINCLEKTISRQLKDYFLLQIYDIWILMDESYDKIETPEQVCYLFYNYFMLQI